jgi:hypothetical protein
MIHARNDYQHIQDETERIGRDEPVILFRAQDVHFLEILNHYRNLVASDGGDPNIVAALGVHIKRARDWRRRNHGRVKPPDMYRMDIRPPEVEPVIRRDDETPA